MKGGKVSAMHSDFIVFVDESGDHSLTKIDQQYPMFVLAFCVVPFNTYNSQIAPRVRELKFRLFGHDNVILHEHDIRKRKGPFSAMGLHERELLMNELTSIVQESDMTIIAVAVHKQRHAKRYVRPIHPYNLAVMFGLERLHGFMRDKGQHERLTHVVCEARGAQEDRELELEFRRVCDGANQRQLRFCFDIVIADKRTNSEGLQLADLVARPIGLHALRPDQHNHAWEVIRPKLLTDYRGRFEGYGLKMFP